MVINDPKKTIDVLGLGKKEQKRSDRVADVIQKELAVLLIRDIRDPLLTDVYFTRVEVTDDLKIARIFFSVLGPGGRIPVVERALQKAKGFMRSHIAKTINMRFTPALQFRYDTTAEKAEQLESIFREIAEERKQHDENT